MATKQQMTKALVRALTKALVKSNGHRHPVKRVKAQVVRHTKGHAGRNGQHSKWCTPHVTSHCAAIVTAEDKDEPVWRRGQECGLCLTVHTSWREWSDLWNGRPVCLKHFQQAMRKRMAARR